MNYKEYYETNEDFKEYVDKYCVKHNITTDEAIKHYTVQFAADYYKAKEDNK